MYLFTADCILFIFKTATVIGNCTCFTMPLGLLNSLTVQYFKYMEQRRNTCQLLIKFFVLSGTQNCICVFKKKSETIFPIFCQKDKP
jgi:hypothetical protein